MNYYPEQLQEQGVPLVSKYAYGEDYHLVIRKKLHALLEFIRQEVGAVNGRGFVDSAPVLERSWAVKSGLGWIGKNGNLIHRQSGSFFFIATLIVDLELEYDTPHVKDYCGTCNRCVEACPTEAILPDKTIRGDQCISYFTIELKSLDFNTDLKWKDWMFGCDICQDVCPWNRFAKAQNEDVFHPKKELFNFQFEDWEKMDKTKFQQIFKDSPLKRSGFERIQRNLRFLKVSHQK
jgi:epoxyqueuosine reductase